MKNLDIVNRSSIVGGLKLGFLLIFMLSTLSIGAQDNIIPRRVPISPLAGSYPTNPASNSIHVNRKAEYKSYTPEEFVKKIFLKNDGGGDCVSDQVIKNVTFSGFQWSGTAWMDPTATNHDRSLSYFDNGTAIDLGMESGILMTTAGGLKVEGPNQSDSNLSGTNGASSYAYYSTASDTDLKGLLPSSGQTPTAGAVLEFDFIPQQSEITFEYIFASEEYPEYVNQDFNDVFGFFISGPGISGKQNIALLPEGETVDANRVVSINNVNNGHFGSNAYSGTGTGARNSKFFIPNKSGSASMEYDGRTIVLIAKATVIPGQTYHLKLAVSNVNDNAYGSGVFLKGGSFDIGLGITNFGNQIEGMNNIFQSCTNNKFVIKAFRSASVIPVTLVYEGTGASYVCKPDNTALPTSVQIPAMTGEISIPYKVKDNVTANGADFTIKAYLQGCSDPLVKTIKVYKHFSSVNHVVTAACNNDGSFYLTAQDGSPAIQMSKDGNNWQRINKPFTGLAVGNHTVYVKDSISCKTETIVVAVQGPPSAPTISPSGNVVMPSDAGVTLTSSLGVSYQWYRDGVLISGATGQSYVANQEGSYTVKIKNAGGCESAFSERVAVLRYPDNIVEFDCYAKPSQTNWMPKLVKRSERDIHILAQLFVGDIDGDGDSEVVTVNRNTDESYTYSNSILIFDKELALKKEIFTPRMITRTAVPMVLVKVNPADKHSLIVIVTDGVDGYKLRAYKPDGTAAWAEANISTVFNPGSGSLDDASICLVAGDINNDGIPEILAGDRIFNAQTGRLVANLPNGAGYGRGYRLLNASAANRTYMPALADIDNDGELEVVGGNTTYKVNIVNPNPTNATEVAQNTVSVLAQAAGVEDGFVSVADIDLDGQPDVVVVTTPNNKPTLTVWNGKTGAIIAGPISPSAAGGAGSRAFIGNVDLTPEPEIFFSYVNQLVSFRYDGSKGTPATRLVEKWVRSTTDGSGGTTLSMFDFDHNDKAELVYRDQTHLRIIDGETGENLKRFDCFSATHSEYPIIVDFNRDGHADILVSGASSSSLQNSDVRIYWFSGADNDWAPARTVWNQHGYNSIHVNEDLSIPRFQLNPSTIFSGRNGVYENGGGDDVRPYNGYLLQQTTLSKDGVSLFLTPDVHVKNASEIEFNYDNASDVLTISKLYVKNEGDAKFNGPLNITVYKNNISYDGSTKIHTYSYGSDIEMGETKTISFTVPKFGQYIPVNNLVVKINDKGTGYNDKLVCDSCCVNNESGSFANIDLSALAWADSYRKCEGDNVKFTAANLSGGQVTYEWYTPANNLLAASQTTTVNNLTLNQGGRYVFKAKKVNGNLSLSYTLPHLSVAPAKMYWRIDAADNDWNNINNWAKSEILGDNILAVPSTFTDVVLPGRELISKQFYPSLDTISTNYKIYGSPTVNKITFRYGSEVAYPHNLVYNQAYVQYNWGHYSNNGDMSGVGNNSQPSKNVGGLTVDRKDRGRWYALAAPLKHIASGDFSLAGYPLTWQAMFEAKVHPSTGQLTVCDFSKAFKTNDVDLSTSNNAIAIKIAPYNTGVGYKDHRYLESLKGIIELPYFEDVEKSQYYQGHSYDPISKVSQFYYFNTNTLQQLHSPIGKMKRDEKAYRFIYETATNQTPIMTFKGQDDIAVYTQTVKRPESGSSLVMIGNPFMASINTNRFIEANADKLNKGAGYYIYGRNEQGEDPAWRWQAYLIDNNIAALQAFVVTLKDNVNTADLYFPLEGDYALTGANFKGIHLIMPIGRTLYMKSSNSHDESSDYATLDISDSGDVKSNVPKLFSSESHTLSELFFITANGAEYNLHQTLSGSDNEVRIGIKNSQAKEDMIVTFSNVDEFSNANNVYPVLVDSYLNIEQNLLDNNVYRFQQRETSAENQYVDADRLILRLRSKEDIADVEQKDILIRYENRTLDIRSVQQLSKVYLYDLQGRQIHVNESVVGQNYNKYLPLAEGIYIVKIQTLKGEIINEKIKVQ